MAGSAVWHPNTQMSEWESFDRIVRGDGMWLVDSRGRRMLDGVASMWCNVWGHSNQELVQAIARQAQRLQHSPLFNLTNGPAETLAGMLVKASPGMYRAFFSDNGSSAIEIALKMAIKYWQNTGENKKTIIASLKNGYHGDTLGAMSAGYMPEFFDSFRSHTFRARQFDAPSRRGTRRGSGRSQDKDAYDTDRCLDIMEKALAGNDRIAALVMESGAQVAGGVHIFPDGFQRSVQRICRRHGVLLILDEVATGLGRLGSMIQYMSQQSPPDIVVYGKMLTGGYLTMAATIATKRIHDAFLGRYDDSVHLFHGHTYTGNPIAASAAVQNIRMYKKYRLIRHVERASRIFAEQTDMIRSMDAVVDIRTKGLLMGIEVSEDRMPSNAGSANKVFFEAGMRNGIYLRTLGNVVMLVPPLAISEEELGMVVRRAVKTIRDVTNS